MLRSCFHEKAVLLNTVQWVLENVAQVCSQGQIFNGMAPNEKENALQWHCQSPDPETLFKRNNYSFVLGRQM